MPAYFSIEYSFPYDCFSSDFTRNIYETVFEDFPFQSGYWNSEENSLEEIIAWNSKLLSEKSELGYDQHVKHNYKQILLQSHQFSHLRLFWMYRHDEVVLHLILPEDEIQLEDDSEALNKIQIAPLLHLSLKILKKYEVNMVQTYRELGEPAGLKDIADGEFPLTDPFSFVRSDLFKETSDVPNNFEKVAQDKGILLIEKEYTGLLDQKEE